MIEQDAEEQYEQWRRGSSWNTPTTAAQDEEERASWSPPCASRRNLSYLVAREIADFVVPQATNYDVPEIVRRVTHIGYLGCVPPIWMVQSTLCLSAPYQNDQAVRFSVTQLVQRTGEGRYAFVRGAYMRFPEEEE
jgi:hypothetical protein